MTLSSPKGTTKPWQNMCEELVSIIALCLHYYIAFVFGSICKFNAHRAQYFGWHRSRLSMKIPILTAQYGMGILFSLK